MTRILLVFFVLCCPYFSKADNYVDPKAETNSDNVKLYPKIYQLEETDDDPGFPYKLSIRDTQSETTQVFKLKRMETPFSISGPYDYLLYDLKGKRATPNHIWIVTLYSGATHPKKANVMDLYGIYSNGNRYKLKSLHKLTEKDHNVLVPRGAEH